MCQFPFLIVFGLDRTYEELKQKSSAFFSSKQRTVWIVPMRNWNRWYALFAFVVWLGLDRTYEELKRGRVRGTPESRGTVWIVPMRNWNEFFFGEYLFNTMFGSYLWGIETDENQNQRRKRHSPGLDRTYEELKQPFCETFGCGVQQRLDRTYEELKLAKAQEIRELWDGFGSYLWGIETRPKETRTFEGGKSLDRTYEELKRGWKWYVGSQRFGRFGSYLWGIETSCLPASVSFETVFGSYLWGIETSISTKMHPSRLWRLDRTYEELKPFSKLFSASSLVGLDRTYEELKHSWPSQKNSKPATVWIVPMRNWNSSAKNSFTNSFCPFGSYLWGIETVSVRCILFSPFVWIVPMRNWNE